MHIVLLLGSSTAGKSSLCKELVAKYQWHSGSIDECYDQMFNERMAKLNPILTNALINHNMMETLSSVMTKENILLFACIGQFTITKDGHTFSHQFQNPTLEKLDEVLIKSGIDDHEIPVFSHILRLITKISSDFFKDNSSEDLMEQLYDETFHKNNSRQSIVLDVVPPIDSSLDDFIKRFEIRAQQYREQNPTETIITSVVFAYCPLLKLSERIQQRNLNAARDNPKDKREGLFPFYQLASMVTAEHRFNAYSKNIVSKNDLFSLIDKHANTTKTSDAVFLENPFDPEIFQTNECQTEVTVVNNGLIKLASTTDSNMIFKGEMARIGSKKTIKEYGKLANKFGFFENQERISLNIPQGIRFDAIINTAKGTPVTLAQEFIEKLENNKFDSTRSCNSLS